MITAPDFRPARLIRHPQIQSILASKSPQRRRWLKAGSTMEAAAQYLELDAGDGVRLTGYLSRQAQQPRGLVVLIHGWEGHHNSTYLYSMACALYGAGYTVFRLNLRDHGGSHHLNREVFHSARIAEVVGAIRAVQQLEPTPPLFVIGFSLGGNFSLRVGLHGPAAGVMPQLAIGICPSINPRATITAIDQGSPMFRWYFKNKWRATVNAKVQAWPEYAAAAQHYLNASSMLDITARFAAEQTGYADMDAYLQAYTLTTTALMDSPSPLAIITAADDPVIPVGDFAGLSTARALRALDITAHGGHCGFIENLRLQSWAERRVLALLERHST